MDEDRNLPMREKLDFKQVLFEQMIQIMKNSFDINLLETSIKVLDCTLSPYRDGKYKSVESEIKNKYDRAIRQSRDNKTGKYIKSEIEEARWNGAYEKFEALMSLAKRKGLLPEESLGEVSLRDRI